MATAVKKCQREAAGGMWMVWSRPFQKLNDF